MCSYRDSQFKLIASLLERGTGHVHFVGIGGIGMAGLAYLLKSIGFEVSGCDLRLGDMSEWLRGNGVSVIIGHSANHITDDVDFVVRSTAVRSDSPELLRAMELDIPVFLRGMVLPHLLNGYGSSIAVSGTHGKTTTSTFVAMLLRFAGIEVAWCIGGESDFPGGVAGAGARERDKGRGGGKGVNIQRRTFNN